MDYTGVYPNNLFFLFGQRTFNFVWVFLFFTPEIWFSFWHLAVWCLWNTTSKSYSLIGQVGRVFTNDPRDWVLSQVESYQWSNPGKGVAPSLHLSVVAIEKGAFRSPLTMIANFTCHIYIYIYIYIYQLYLPYIYIYIYIYIYCGHWIEWALVLTTWRFAFVHFSSLSTITHHCNY